MVTYSGVLDTLDKTRMSDTSDCCSVCLCAVVAETQTRVNLACSHTFHFRCISEWFSRQEHGTCPMCRKVMSEIDDLPLTEEEEEEEDGEEEEERVSLILMEEYPGNEHVIQQFIDAGEWVRNCEPPYTLAKVRATLTQWIENEGEVAEGQGEQRELVEDYQRAITTLTRLIGEVPPALLPETLVSLSRSEISEMLIRHGAAATVEEFLNEEDGVEFAQEVSMTVGSLSARLLSLGGAPVSPTDMLVPTHGQLGPLPETLEITAFSDGERTVRRKRVLNPEEDALLGPY